MIAFEFYFKFFISYRENVIQRHGFDDFVNDEQRTAEDCKVGENEFRENILKELNGLMDGGDIFEYYSKKNMFSKGLFNYVLRRKKFDKNDIDWLQCVVRANREYIS